MRLKRPLLPVVTILLALVPSVALASDHAGIHHYNTSVCGRKWVAVDLGHGAYTNVYNGQAGAMCISVERRRLAFQVTHWTEGAGAWQFVHLSNGINWGRYSCLDGPSGTGRGSRCIRFPVQVRYDGHPVTSAQAWWPRNMVGNVSYDLWFNRTLVTPSSLKQNNGAEIMIWLAQPNLDYYPHATRYVRIDGIEWAVMDWISFHNNTHWHYVAYMAVRQRRSVTGLRLNPFLREAEAHGELNPNWWWTSANFGAEISHNGRGFDVSSYSLTGVR